MDKTIAGLLGASAIAALSATSAQATGAQATGAPAAVRLDHVMKAETYADLLEPVADPLPLLEASNAVLLTQADETPLTAEPVQYHHHHHHHHSILRRLFRPRRHYHHHHFYHHHHHHHFYRD